MGAESSPASAGKKTLVVLEAAVLNQRFTDIVHDSGLPKSTVHRILEFLVSSDFITGDSERGYRAGQRFMTLAGRAFSQIDVSQIAQPIVDSLVSEVNCTVHVGALSGDRMIYVIRTDASKPYQMRSRIGLSVPLHSTGMGKAVLAQEDQETIRRYAEKSGLPGYTQSTLTDLGALLSELQQIKNLGYSLDLEENEVGTVCVSAPIFDHTGKAVYGISISSLLVEYPGSSIEVFAPQVMSAAAAISQLLGAKP